MSRDAKAYIGTYLGKKFWPLDPTEDEIDINVIAHALSQICRFNGNTTQFFSVAQHSLLVQQYLNILGYNTKVQLLGLLHDATEAYINDIARPIKSKLIGYSDIELNIEKCVYNKYGIRITSRTYSGELKEADNTALLIEALALMGAAINWENWDGLNQKIADSKIIGLFNNLLSLSMKETEKEFLNTFYALMNTNANN